MPDLQKAAGDVLANPLVNGSIARVMEARERAVVAQEMLMGGLNLPTAANLERLTRRLRSVAQRLESIEDTLDQLAQSRTSGLESRLATIEAQLADIAQSLKAAAA